MNLDLQKVSTYVERHIGDFHQKRLSSLDNLKLKTVLRRKNPYLFKTKNVLTAAEIVRSLVDAHLSSNEETIFGDWLEELAIYINKEVYGGWKSGIRGVDLEFDHNNRRYIVSIKSGPNWGNSSQIKKMELDFKTAKKTLRTSNSSLNIVAVNGCCYGRCPNEDKGSYLKYCGQQFWSFISGIDSLYLDIIEPLGCDAKKKNEAFLKIYSQKLNLFAKDFTEEFCTKSGDIDWEALVRFNSGMNKKRD
jgi:hypothetical protein